MEEKMKVLKMLEAGKINAEEAIKLLEALKEPEAPHRSYIVKGIGEAMESVSNIMKDVSQVVGETVKEKVKEAAEKAKKTTEKVKKAAKGIKKKK